MEGAIFPIFRLTRKELSSLAMPISLRSEAVANATANYNQFVADKLKECAASGMFLIVSPMRSAGREPETAPARYNIAWDYKFVEPDDAVPSGWTMYGPA